LLKNLTDFVRRHASSNKMATSVDLNKKKYKYLNLKIYLKNKIKLKREKGLLPNRGVARGYPQNHLGVACGHPNP
jgi:hypothetical protein